jgi:ParB family chromosome partitioning protein
VSKRRLGKGIDALLQGRDLEQLSNMASILHIEIEKIEPNPDQPRKSFPKDSLQELADSIREKGVIQPILAEDRGDGRYTIVAGERRFRAAQIAGLTEIPVISQEFSDEEKLEIALIENIQREDLNPVDEARAIQHILQESGVTQEELAKRLGKSRSAVSNAIRLLSLDDEALEALVSGTLTAGHARALLRIDSAAKRKELYDTIMKDGWSVRKTELEVYGKKKPLDETDGSSDNESQDPEQSKGSPDGSAGVTAGEGVLKSPELQQIEDRLVEHLGGRVVIRGSDHRGKIEVTYQSTEDFERIVEAMGLKL